MSTDKSSFVLPDVADVLTAPKKGRPKKETPPPPPPPPPPKPEPAKVVDAKVVMEAVGQDSDGLEDLPPEELQVEMDMGVRALELQSMVEGGKGLIAFSGVVLEALSPTCEGLAEDMAMMVETSERVDNALQLIVHKKMSKFTSLMGPEYVIGVAILQAIVTRVKINQRKNGEDKPVETK